MRLDKSIVMPATWIVVALLVVVLMVAFGPEQPAPVPDLGQPAQGQ